MKKALAFLAIIGLLACNESEDSQKYNVSLVVQTQMFQVKDWENVSLMDTSFICKADDVINLPEFPGELTVANNENDEFTFTFVSGVSSCQIPMVSVINYIDEPNVWSDYKEYTCSKLSRIRMSAAIYKH